MAACSSKEVFLLVTNDNQPASIQINKDGQPRLMESGDPILPSSSLSGNGVQFYNENGELENGVLVNDYHFFVDENDQVSLLPPGSILQGRFKIQKENSSQEEIDGDEVVIPPKRIGSNLDEIFKFDSVEDLAAVNSTTQQNVLIELEEEIVSVSESRETKTPEHKLEKTLDVVATGRASGRGRRRKRGSGIGKRESARHASQKDQNVKHPTKEAALLNVVADESFITLSGNDSADGKIYNNQIDQLVEIAEAELLSVENPAVIDDVKSSLEEDARESHILTESRDSPMKISANSLDTQFPTTEYQEVSHGQDTTEQASMVDSNAPAVCLSVEKESNDLANHEGNTSAESLNEVETRELSSFSQTNTSIEEHTSQAGCVNEDSVVESSQSGCVNEESVVESSQAGCVNEESVIESSHYPNIDVNSCEVPSTYSTISISNDRISENSEQLNNENVDDQKPASSLSYFENESSTMRLPDKPTEDCTPCSGDVNATNDRSTSFFTRKRKFDEDLGDNKKFKLVSEVESLASSSDICIRSNASPAGESNLTSSSTQTVSSVERSPVVKIIKVRYDWARFKSDNVPNKGASWPRRKELDALELKLKAMERELEFRRSIVKKEECRLEMERRSFKIEMAKEKHLLNKAKKETEMLTKGISKNVSLTQNEPSSNESRVSNRNGTSSGVKRNKRKMSLDTVTSSKNDKLFSISFGDSTV